MSPHLGTFLVRMEMQAAETQGRCGWHVETGLEPAAGEGGVCAAKPGRGTDGKERAVQSWRGQMTCPQEKLPL